MVYNWNSFDSNHAHGQLVHLSHSGCQPLLCMLYLWWMLHCLLVKLCMLSMEVGNTGKHLVCSCGHLTRLWLTAKPCMLLGKQLQNMCRLTQQPSHLSHTNHHLYTLYSIYGEGYIYTSILINTGSTRAHTLYRGLVISRLQLKVTHANIIGHIKYCAAVRSRHKCTNPNSSDTYL